MKKKVIPWKLIISYLKQELDGDDLIEFKQWLDSDDNRLLFEDLNQLWDNIRKETDSYEPDVDFYWKEMQARMKKRPARISHEIKTIITIAASVVLIVVSTAIFYVLNYTKNNSSIQTYTSYNGKSKVILPDSSIVWLNKGSTIRYSTSFSTDRNLELDGEALFDVRKNPSNVFVVHTSGIQVKVYGTQFNVNSYDKDADVKVALFEGSVSIITDNKETHLTPGEIATFNKSAHSIATNHSSKKITDPSSGKLTSKIINNNISSLEDDLNYESFWASENISFDHKDLGYICKYLEKWYKVEINIDSTLAKSQYYTFTLKDEPLELILRNMNKINPIEYSFPEENVVYITSGKFNK